MSSWWVALAREDFARQARLEQPRMTRELDEARLDDDEDHARVWLTAGEYEDALETLIATELKDRGVI